MMVQGTPAPFFFALSRSDAPTEPLTLATFSGNEIVVGKSGTPPTAAAASNIATVTELLPLLPGVYQLMVTGAENNLSLATGTTGEIVVQVNKAGALPRMISSMTVIANAPGTLSTATVNLIRDAVVAGVPTLAQIEAVVAAAVSAILDGVPSPSEIATAVAAPSASTIASAVAAPSTSAIAAAVAAILIDGVPMSIALAVAQAVRAGDGQNPGETGGSFSYLSRDGNTVMLAGTISTAGVRTITTFNGQPV